MAVGIIILSGARQGERLEFDLKEFRAGDNSACQVIFDPKDDRPAQGREALFRLDNDGWSMKNVGDGELLLNGRPVHGSTRLRSGDVLGMSPAGPEFSFNLLARLSLIAAAVPKVLPTPAAAMGAEHHAADPPSPVPTQRRPTVKPLAIFATVIAFAVTGLLVGVRTWQGGAVAVVPRPDDDGERDPEGTKESGDGAPAKRMVPHPRTIGDNGTKYQKGHIDDGDESAHSKSPERLQESGNESPQSKDDDAAGTAPVALPRDAWDVASDELRGAVFLLVVEEPKTQTEWPFATATAIDEDTLLTSATVAAELARFRQRGWKLWAMNQKSGSKIEVVHQHVHVGFERAAGQPELQIYADLGLATLASKCTHAAALATAEELDELDRGQPLACLGIAHDGESLNRFQNYSPEMTRGKVFVITSLPPSPDGPRLLHVRMTLAAKVYGAPVVNEAGRVVGVFAESAPPPADDGGTELNLHYFAVIDLSMVRAWLERRDEALWMPPSVPPEPAAETKGATP